MAVGREGEDKIRGVFAQVSFSLDPMALNFNDPNDLVEGPIIWQVGVEEVEMRSANVPGARRAK